MYVCNNSILTVESLAYFSEGKESIWLGLIFCDMYLGLFYWSYMAGSEKGAGGNHLCEITHFISDVRLTL